MPRWINVANLLTLGRLVLVPWIVKSILDGDHLRALALFSVAAFTDAADGAVARRFSLTSQVGAYLDPVADKALLSGVFLALAAAGIVPWWFVLVVFGRDLYILAAVGLLIRTTSVRKFPPSVWGKLSTLVQVLTAVAWMIRNLQRFPLMDPVAAGLLWVCTATTVWSGLHYTRRGIQIVRAH